MSMLHTPGQGRCQLPLGRLSATVFMPESTFLPPALAGEQAGVQKLPWRARHSLRVRAGTAAVTRVCSRPAGTFSPITLALFFILYFLLACWTFGTSVPSGLFVPSLLCGAAFGRLVANVLKR